MYNLEQFKHYNKSISVLKFDLEAYLSNCNQVIDFLS